MGEVNDDREQYFKMDRTKFEYMDEGYEERKIQEQLKMNYTERFFAMEYLREQMVSDKNYSIDWSYFEIRK
jgi:hypothetical protein